MATISKRRKKDGKVSYTVQVRRKGHPPLVNTFSRREDADAWATMTERRVKLNTAGIYTEADKHTLSEAIERYRREVAKDLKDPTERDAQLNWWIQRLGSLTLAQVTSARVSEAKGVLRTEKFTRAKGPSAKEYERSPATVNRYLAALGVVLNLCAGEWKWLPASPMSSVKKYKEPRGRVRMLSDVERAALLKACRDSTSPYLHTIMTVALVTGARRSEVASLTWPQVDLKRGAAVVHDTKNGERRTIHLHGHALKALLELRKVPRLDTQLVFPSPADAQRPYDFESAWQTALKRAGIKDFRFHDLRHSAASYLAMDGHSLGTIAEILGHKTLQMTKRYTHLTESHVGAAVKRMADKMAAIDDDDDEKTAPAEPASSTGA